MRGPWFGDLQSITPEPPFRWDVRKREQLGSLLDGWQPDIPDAYVDALIACCARVLAFCADGELFFVGRSPDNLFDLLSGAFAGTSWEERIRQLPVSLKWGDEIRKSPTIRDSLRHYLAYLTLSPEQINSRPRPTVLVDVVAEGQTYGELVTAWHAWAGEQGVPWAQMRRKLRLIGLTRRTKTSPKTWRWQQHASWSRLLRPDSIKNVSVHEEVWGQLAESPKATGTFTPWVWFNRGNPGALSRHPLTIQGIREAAYWYESGRSTKLREQLAAELTRSPGVCASWLRALAHEMRAHSGEPAGYTPEPDDTSPGVRLQLEARRAKRLRYVIRRNMAASLAIGRRMRHRQAR